ncbi:TRAP transporter small permease [Futiania mangrovi]|uniref:TRAP transporter small permease protein n=1 Tax=Futiania mangrovi TaxID=2959716 RepID=A0A9J6PH08_9PROT|nr:TRAP transporter small permease [Futiania mangrovii]MCP1337091.1 TRAP transporter small permease [Futiania mangrovii]
MTTSQKALPRPFRAATRLVRRATDLSMVFAGIALVLMTVHVVADVTARVVFNSPIPGTLEIVAFYYMVAAIVFPAGYLERRDEHITVELFYMRLSPFGQRICYAFSGLLTAVFFSIFAYQSWLDALKATRTREMVMGAAQIEIWPARYVLPISFALLVLVAVLNVVRVVLRPHETPTNKDTTADVGEERTAG